MANYPWSFFLSDADTALFLEKGAPIPFWWNWRIL